MIYLKGVQEEIKKAGFKNRDETIKEGKEIKEKLNKTGPEWEEAETKYREFLYKVPNITHPDSPIGQDDSENKEVERYGEEPKFDFTPRNHEELGKDLDIIDFERAAKVSGSKFYYLKNEGALLELALIQLCF